MAPMNRTRTQMLVKMIAQSRRRRRFWENGIFVAIHERNLMIKALFLATILLISNNESRRCASRIARRLPRNTGWWQTVWNTYSEKRFKQTFRVSRKTFNFILSRIHHKLERQTLCEEPVSP